MTKVAKQDEVSESGGWSITRLSNELRVPRQTVAGHLANVAPIGKRGLAKLYALHDAVRAIFGQSTVADQQRHQAMILQAKAETAQLELAKAKGQLLRRQDVEKAQGDIAHALREGFLLWPDRVAPVIAPRHKANAKKLALDLEEQMRSHLETSSLGLLDGAGGSPGRNRKKAKARPKAQRKRVG